jgi:hypothetical protein
MREARLYWPCARFARLPAMWCSTCQHDVPRTASAGGGLVRCQQCGTTLGYDDAPHQPDAAPALALHCETMPQLPDDDWQIEADVRSLERLIAGLHAARFDQPTPLAPPHTLLAVAPAHGEAAELPAQSPPKSNLAAWSVLSLGLAILSCGAVLMGLSYVQERDDLWSLGLPLAIGGQAALIIGLVLQLEGLWHSNRQTARTLNTLDGELSRMRQATGAASTR